MKSISIKKTGIYLSLFLMISAEAWSQASYKLNQEGSKMTILGTASNHDWQLMVKDINCSATMVTDGGKISEIEEAWFSCHAKSIIAEHKIMSKHVHKLLKAKEFSNIIFVMKEGEISSITENEFLGTVSGHLFISGLMKKVTLPFEGNILQNGKIALEGEANLKMTEFNIEPPVSFNGKLTTGDDISVTYSFLLESDISKDQISEVEAISSTAD